MRHLHQPALPLVLASTHPRRPPEPLRLPPDPIGTNRHTSANDRCTPSPLIRSLQTAAAQRNRLPHTSVNWKRGIK
ncbi:hypothetical protein SDJN03_10165, partial [Cucurbita argyrosperma subsp. sororia]